MTITKVLVERVNIFINFIASYFFRIMCKSKSIHVTILCRFLETNRKY